MLAIVPLAGATRIVQTTGTSEADAIYTANAGGGLATATFELKVSTAGPVRLLVLPMPGNPAYSNGTETAGWWTQVRAAKSGLELASRGGTAGGAPLPLGDWDANTAYQVEVAVRIPAPAIQPGRSFRIQYAAAAPEPPSGSGSGGELEASVGFVMRIQVPASSGGGGGGAAVAEPLIVTQSAAPAPPVTNIVTVMVPAAPDRSRDSSELASIMGLEPWSAREVALLALLMLAVGYLAGARRRRANVEPLLAAKDDAADPAPRAPIP